MPTLFTVIIPNYNELPNLRRGVLAEVNTFLLSQKETWEVIISDDGSTDGSREFMCDFVTKHRNFRFLENPHAGKPFALRSAIRAARGKYVLLTDMDQSTPIQELAKLLPWVHQGYDVVIGSRGSRRTDSTFFRQIASVIFQSARRMILLPHIQDTQCGFKLIETKLARDIFSQIRIFGRDRNAAGWKVTAYDVEMLFIASKMHKPIKEVKVIWKNTDTSVGKQRNFVKESIEMFTEILRVRVNYILGKYD